MNELKCPICGEPTYLVYGKYPRKDGLCSKCGKKLRDGLIEQCPNCGKWHNTNETCECKKNININNHCLVCGKESGEYFFCKEHYEKYKNKTILFKIKVEKGQHIELLDDSYEGMFTCKDGHIVKSKSERDIDNYLFEHKIAHAYEKTITINEEQFKPDFYLPDLDVYIEHWGYNEDNIEYTKQKDYKIKKYIEKGITLICTNEKEMKDIDATLDMKFAKYKKGKINI
ncbi:MAG: hypothetical protein ACI4MT_04670 [Christensenellales bacterium]